jgi:TonB family protein
MRICVLVSLLLHAMLLFTLRNAFSSYWARQDLRTYNVELLRPPIENMDDEEKANADVAKPRQEEKPPPSHESQDTISLDTTDKRYVDYARVIKERIMAQWKYPREARENLVEGRLLVLFSLSRQGSMTEIKVTKSSGHEILDHEAARAISSAAPFPPFPEHITVTRLNIKASFDYRLKARP